MAVKDILLALTSYPEPTPVSAVDEAIAFTVALGARISAIACEVKFRVPGNLLGGALLDVPAMAAAEAKKSSTNAEKLLVAFQDAAEKRGVFQDRILEHCLTSDVPELLIEYARLRDLTIVPVPEGDYFEQWYAELIIFGSGRPTLLSAACAETRRRICTRYSGRGLGFQSTCVQGHRRRTSDLGKSKACVRCNSDE